jgi:tRNA modification GTPase
VNDITCGIHNSDQLYNIAKELNSDADICFIHNKADHMKDEYINDSHNIYSSVPHNYGLQDILNYISRCISKTDIHMSFLLNQRQVDLLKDYQNNIYSALELAKNGETTDVLAVDLRSALDSLGLIIGTIYNEDLLNDVFASMCIGK